MNKKLLMILCSGVFIFGFALKGIENKAGTPIDEKIAAEGRDVGEVDVDTVDKVAGEQEGANAQEKKIVKNLPLIVSVVINPEGEIVDIEGVQLPDNAMRKLINSKPDAANLWRRISNETECEADNLETKDIHNMSFSKALQISGNGILKTLNGVGRMSFIVLDRYVIPLGKKISPHLIKISKDTASYLKLWALWSYRNGIQPCAHFVTRKTPEGVRQFFNKCWGKIKDKNVKVWKDVDFQLS